MSPMLRSRDKRHFLAILMANTNLLQWNIRSLQANREQLSLLIFNSDPAVIYLQETFQKADGTSCHNNLISHHEAVIINRLKIGHSHLTHLTGDVTSDLEWTARRRCFGANTFKFPAST